MKCEALDDESELDIAGLIESLQGQWEDDVGLSIKVKGNEVVSWLDSFLVVLTC